MPSASVSTVNATRLIGDFSLAPLWAFSFAGLPMRVALELVNCREIVRKRITRLTELLVVMGEPAVPSEFACGTVAAALGPEVGGEVGNLVLGEVAQVRSRWRSRPPPSTTATRRRRRDGLLLALHREGGRLFVLTLEWLWLHRV